MDFLVIIYWAETSPRPTNKMRANIAMGITFFIYSSKGLKVKSSEAIHCVRRGEGISR